MSSAWNSDWCQAAVKVSSFISSIDAMEASTRHTSKPFSCSNYFGLEKRLDVHQRHKVKPGHSPWRPNTNPGHQCHHYSSVIKGFVLRSKQTTNKERKQQKNKQNQQITNYIQDLYPRWIGQNMLKKDDLTAICLVKCKLIKLAPTTNHLPHQVLPQSGVP